MGRTHDWLRLLPRFLNPRARHNATPLSGETKFSDTYSNSDCTALLRGRIKQEPIVVTVSEGAID